MVTSTRKFASVALAAIGLSAGLASVAKADVLNGSRTSGSISSTSRSRNRKSCSRTPSQLVGRLVRAARTATLSALASKAPKPQCGRSYDVYPGPPASRTLFRAASTSFRRTVTRNSRARFLPTISGLTAGNTYTLQFQQAAGQQTNFSGDTTEQWKVFLGVGGISTRLLECDHVLPDRHRPQFRGGTRR